MTRFIAIVILGFALGMVTMSRANEPVPDTLALNDEDAQTCKVKACRTITDGAYNLIAGRIQQLEEQNERLRGKLAVNPKFCL